MNRNLAQLARTEYDVLVIGAGIYGACVAWDAALRGLSVALIDKGDFGHATSANSLKVLHGGLRYLQDGNPRLVRRMIRERTTWMAVAPHLAHPLPCLMPTTTRLTRGRAALRAALLANDLLGFDRNRLGDPEKRLSNGRIVSRDECLRMLPGIAPDGITGGALWHDARMDDSERLLLSFVLAAAGEGADVANYVEAASLLRASARDGEAVRGIVARDTLDGATFDIRARVVVNCAGAWVDAVTGAAGPRRFVLSTAINLVTRPLFDGHAAGIPATQIVRGPGGEQTRQPHMLFVVPWQDCSIVGTLHSAAGNPDQPAPEDEQMVEDLLAEINTACPGARMTRDDVRLVHRGFLPMNERPRKDGTVSLVRESRIHDHAGEDGIAGLITVVGVKYTTARATAEQVVDLAVAKLRKPARPCHTERTPVYGGQIEDFDGFLAQAVRSSPRHVPPEAVERLVYRYGSEYHRILEYGRERPEWGQPLSEGAPTLGAEVAHAVRCEMAPKLADVVQRRTGLGGAGVPHEAALAKCADIMGSELGWSAARRDAEMREVRAAFGRAAFGRAAWGTRGEL
jgi:glycerol-3-phosphate dehydrogenase